MAVNSLEFTPWLGPEEASKYFQFILDGDISEQQAYESTEDLLNRVHQGAIGPKTFAIWLFLAQPKFPNLIRLALRDELSRGVRHAGMNAIKVAMRTDQWREKGWNAAGGTSGLKEIFESISISEVKQLAHAIGACAKTRDASKSQAVDELLELLIPKFLGTTSSEGGSGQLLKPTDLVSLFNVSSDATLLRVFRKERPQRFINAIIPQLLESHMALLRGIFTGSLSVYPPLRQHLIENHAHRILTSCEPYQCKEFPDSTSMTPAMGLCIDLIADVHQRKTKKAKVSRNALMTCVIICLNSARRAKMAFHEILRFLEWSLPHVTSVEFHLHGWKPLLSIIIQYWATSAFPHASLESVSNVAAARHREKTHPSRPQLTHKEPLEVLLGDIFRTIPKTSLKGCLEFCFNGIVADAKLPLLKIMCKHLSKVDIDLDHDTPSENEKQLLPLDSQFFFGLPAKDARWLFERLSGLPSTQKLVNLSQSSQAPPGIDQLSWVESLVNVNLETLSRRQTVADDSPTMRLVEEIKLKAVKERDAKDRLQWAISAVQVAAMSKNVQILQGVIDWTRRFTRDPIVKPELSNRIYSSDVASALSCVALPLRRLSSLEALSADVRIADGVLAQLMTMAVEGLKEPWYRDYQDRSFKTLLNNAMLERLQAVKPLCQLRLGDEKAVVGTLFNQLVSMICEHEKIGLIEEYERLGWSDLVGPIGSVSFVRGVGVEVLKMMDTIAQRRDEIWAEQRLRRKPQTASLPDGLPRGLPIQYLFPNRDWIIAVMNVVGAESFAAKRVKSIVFCDAAIQLRKLTDDDHCIGSFVDSLPFALEAYLGKRSPDEQSSRLLELWNRLASTGYAECFRQHLCQLARGRRLHGVVRIIDPPRLPSLNIFRNARDDTDLFEWDPRSNDQDHQTAAYSEQTLLHHQLDSYRTGMNLATSLRSFKSPTAGNLRKKNIPFDIWRPKYGPQRLSHQHQEALIVSAVLFLSTLASNKNRLLSQPFPGSTGSLRYPPVHLDYEFLASIEDQNKAADYALSVLEKLVKLVPPTLLKQLSLSLLETLVNLDSSSPRYPLVQKCTFQVMSILRRSDRPEMAAVLALKAVEMFPQASSWHRMVFPASLGNLLTRKAAESTLEEFVAFIVGALVRYKESTAKRRKVTESGRVKITTIKMLASMLGETKFGASLAFASRTLKTLFEGSNHIDIRATACAAVLDIIADYAETEDVSGIYEIFTSFAPYAHGPSEITAPGTWLDSDQSDNLPQVEDQRPLLDLIVRTAKRKLPDRYHEHYTQNVILPLVYESTRQNNIWMKRFLSRLDLTPEEKSVTYFGPFARNLPDQVLEGWLNYLPREYLLQHRSWALQYLDCCKLENINERLREQDRGWDVPDAGRHWEKWVNAHTNSMAYNRLPIRLKYVRNPAVTNGITNDAIAEELVERAGIILRNPIRYTSSKTKVSLEPFTEILTKLQITNDERGRARFLPLLERVVADANSLRTEEWMRDTNRSPPILPPRLQLQTVLLPFPHLDESKSPSRHERFVSRVVALIEESVMLETYIPDGHFLREAMQQVAMHDLLPCAIGIGLEYESSAHPVVQYLRVRFAQILLERRQRWRDDCKDNIAQLTSHWKASTNESIRAIGWSI